MAGTHRTQRTSQVPGSEPHEFGVTGDSAPPADEDLPPPALRPSIGEQELIRHLSIPAGRHENSDQFRSLVEAAADAILIADLTSKSIIDANRAACELTGYTLNELRSLPVAELLAPAERETLLRVFHELGRRGRVWHPSLRMQRKAGSTFFGEVRITLYGPPTRRLAAAIVRDVSERIDREAEVQRSYEALQEAQSRLTRSEEKYRTLVEAANDAIVILDLNTGRFVEANRAASSLFGYSAEDFRGLDEQRLFDESDAGRSLRLIREEPGWKPNVRLRRKDGSALWAEIHAANYEATDTAHTMAIIRDVTWRVEREEELADSYRMLEETQAKLVQASKLSAMGEIGAGIAHELNQPITIIQGFAQRIFRRPQTSIADHLDELQIIIDEAGRMARIVDNIRTFARQSNFKPEPINPLLPLKNALELMGAQLTVRGIEVLLHVEEPLPGIEADRLRLQQVFLNLIVNARDALEELGPDEPKKLLLTIQGDRNTLHYVIEDTGPGIPPALAERVFEPFYTSKEPGEGTGLGLSIAYGIIKDHQGEIRLEQRAAGGARFVISLPSIAHVPPNGGR